MNDYPQEPYNRLDYVTKEPEPKAHELRLFKFGRCWARPIVATFKWVELDNYEGKRRWRIWLDWEQI